MPGKISFNAPHRQFSKDENLKAKILEFIDTGPYLNGDFLTQFENDFAAYIGADFCIGVASGTVALELAFLSLDLPRGSEVLMNAHAGSYAAIAALKAGLCPSYFDINMDSTPNFESLQGKISSNTRAVVLTNLYGLVSDIQKFYAFLKLRNVYLIEDCAQSCGARYPNSSQFAGSVSDISTFSFYPTKNLGTFGDAGAVVTSNQELVVRARHLRQYGWEQRYFASHKGGSNFRMDDLHALVLSHKLPSLESRNLARIKIWRTLVESLSDSSLDILGSDGPEFVAHLAVVRSKEPNHLGEYLLEKGIETSKHYPFPDYMQPAFTNYGNGSLKVTENHCVSILSVPLYPELSESEVLRISYALNSYRPPKE
jgi:dTDP-4-amino-4,6-dideoxygalactose transaminase